MAWRAGAGVLLGSRTDDRTRAFRRRDAAKPGKAELGLAPVFEPAQAGFVAPAGADSRGFSRQAPDPTKDHPAHSARQH